MHEVQHAIQNIEGFATGTDTNNPNYSWNPGEIEARDVANRLDYTPEQRKNIRPDVDRTDVVFADGDGESFSTKDDVLKLDVVDWMDNFSSIKDQLTKHSVRINKMSPVCIVTFNPSAKNNLSTIILDIVKQLGGKNMKNKNVTFSFDEKGTHNMLLHAKSAELQAAALSAPYVAKYGDLIAGQKNHESTGLTTLTFAAPVIINEDTVNVGVAIQFLSNGKPRAVNVEFQSGEKFVIDTKKVPAGLDSRVERYVQGTTLPTTGTDKNIPQKTQSVNSSISENSENDKKFTSMRESIVKRMKAKGLNVTYDPNEANSFYEHK